MITQEYLKSRYEYNPETGHFISIVRKQGVRVGKPVGCKNSLGYIAIHIGNKAYGAHRLAWLYTYGEFPKGFIDHKNRVRDDNSLCNLREADLSQNTTNQNISKNNTSGRIGISFSNARGKWISYIKKNGVHIHLGSFEHKLDAILMREYFEPLIHGEFASGAN